jgi:phosphate-selective porin OprO/OprP
MKLSIPHHPRRHKLTATLLATVLFASPAMAGLEDAKAILEVLLKKGVISQKDYDKTLEEWNSKPLESVPPVQFVQDALGVHAKEVQKAVEYTKKDEKNGSVQPSGFGWVSADGENSIKLTGLVHFDARNINNGLTTSEDKDSASGADNFEVRRARIGINGTLYKNIDFEVLTNLVGSSSNLVHRAYINYNYNKQAQVRVGRFKQPFSLEEQTSANAIDFMERSYGNQMVAAQRNGAMVFGEPTKGLTYAVSAYQDGFNELSNTNHIGTLGIGRVTANLAELRGASTDTVIHLGAAVDRGKYEVVPTTSSDTGVAASTITRATVLSFRTENRGMANAYRAQIAGDTVTAGYGIAGNNAANVNKNLQGLELALATGPFKFQSEYFNSTFGASSKNYCVDATTGCTAGSLYSTNFDIKAKAAYYEFFYNLTGESWANSYKSGAFTTVKPKANFSSGSGGGWGAWQLGVRYSTYDVTEPTTFTGRSNVAGAVSTGSTKVNSISGWTSRGENSEKAQTLTLGLNWILNPNSRILMNYSETYFDRPVTYLTTTTPATLGSTGSEKVLSLRTQLNF